MDTPTRPDLELVVDGTRIVVVDDGSSLLEVLRDRCGVRSVKDGCSPQGQCGCCTVLVDGRPRVSCVTPARRVRGRDVTTVDGLPAEVRDRWAAAFATAGGSQCGFCTPGIISRFEGLRREAADSADREVAQRALRAHLCRCTGWQPIVDAWVAFPNVDPDRTAGSGRGGADRVASDRRATLEGGSPQWTGHRVALGEGGFADDTAPPDALVAVRRGDGQGWAVGETLTEARSEAGKVQGRRSTARWGPPLEVPAGDWAVTLRTSWVEPAYLETDASWCSPGGEPASPLANGGAFGAKTATDVAATARRLADEHGRAVRVLWSREDVIRHGPKRPPVAIGMRPDGTGAMRVVRTPGVAEVIAAVAPGLDVQEVDVAGPPTSVSIRGAGWVEALVARAGARGEVSTVTSPAGGVAEVAIGSDGSISVTVDAGEVLDETVLRSYSTGAAHMAWSWVTSESLGVDEHGEVRDLTLRSLGIAPAASMPPVHVEIAVGAGEPVNGSDAVFAAVAAAVWLDRGCPTDWPDR